MNVSTINNDIHLDANQQKETIQKSAKEECIQANQETIAAMLEAEKITNDPSTKGYRNLEHLFNILDA